MRVDTYTKEYLPSRPGVPDDDRYHGVIELRDGQGRLVGEVGDYEDASFLFDSSAKSVEGSSISIPGSSPYARIFMRANRQILLVHFMLYRGKNLVKLWTGRVERSSRKNDRGVSSVSVELISDKAWLQYIMCWSAPFGPLEFQAPKKEDKGGPAINTMKQYAVNNLIRIQGSWWNPISMADMAYKSTYMERPGSWSTLEEFMPIMQVVPTTKAEDTSPTIFLSAKMDSVADVWDQACRDHNLLPEVKFHVPGRDTLPDRLKMSGSGIWIDIKDKDVTRARSEKKGFFEQITKEIGIFVRGLFGRYDSPVELDSTNPESMLDYFGRDPADKWVIFRESDEHTFQRETSAFAPTSVRSIAGGKAPQALNKGIELLANTAIRLALAAIGIVFGDLISGELDDILFAYQKADDNNLREYLGKYAFFEDFAASGTTAYTFDSAQALRLARFNATGYKTATYTIDGNAALPFRIFEDFDLLDPVAWEDGDEGRLFAERLKEVTVKLDRENGVTFDVALGESERPEEPWAIQARRNDMMKQWIKSALFLD
jgi:hypothetical protein